MDNPTISLVPFIPLLKCLPFKLYMAAYPHTSYIRHFSNVKVVDQLLVQHDRVLQTTCNNVLRAQWSMKAIADNHHLDISLLLVKLQLYRQLFRREKQYYKRSHEYYDSFEVLERIGEVA